MSHSHFQCQSLSNTAETLAANHYRTHAETLAHLQPIIIEHSGNTCSQSLSHYRTHVETLAANHYQTQRKHSQPIIISLSNTAETLAANHYQTQRKHMPPIIISLSNRAETLADIII